ncbi:MAG: hypothetical protein DMG11_17305 [Acidobacteria bacterium]|nr:MAG: hypothetical protein DMG11_17305 [Acidobacteriota bacterium]
MDGNRTGFDSHLKHIELNPKSIPASLPATPSQPQLFARSNRYTALCLRVQTSDLNNLTVTCYQQGLTPEEIAGGIAIR